VVPRGLFVADVLERRLTHIAHDTFSGVVTRATVKNLGEAVLVRADCGDSFEAVLRLGERTVALIDSGNGHVGVEVAGDDFPAVERALRTLRDGLAATPPPRGTVSVAFWIQDQYGGEVRHREIRAPGFEEISGNYSAPVRSALTQVVEACEPESGRLIIWRGAPGTGKSHALRALARAWAPWCSAHFIVDAHDLFAHGGKYILDVLAWDGDDSDRWRLIILEDAGELISGDSRAGDQAVSRLLNIADGLLGQGTRTVILVTTNESVLRLHPAARRPGRCLADLEFLPLSPDEANAWLAARGIERRVDRPTPIAELFADAGDQAIVHADGQAASFGFSRVLLRGDPRLALAPNEPQHACRRRRGGHAIAKPALARVSQRRRSDLQRLAERQRDRGLVARTGEVFQGLALVRGTVRHPSDVAPSAARRAGIFLTPCRIHIPSGTVRVAFSPFQEKGRGLRLELGKGLRAPHEMSRRCA
jgi:hypothetical protein